MSSSLLRRKSASSSLWQTKPDLKWRKKLQIVLFKADVGAVALYSHQSESVSILVANIFDSPGTLIDCEFGAAGHIAGERFLIFVLEKPSAHSGVTITAARGKKPAEEFRLIPKTS